MDFSMEPGMLQVPPHVRYIPLRDETIELMAVASLGATNHDAADKTSEKKENYDDEEEDGDLLEVFCTPVNLEQFVYEEEKDQDGKAGLVKQYCGVSVPFLLCLIACVVFIVLCREYLLPFLDWLQKLPAVESIAVFILLFTLVSFPMTFGYLILNLAAGYLYGVIWGQVVVTTSAAFGMSFAFLVCRGCCQDLAHRWINLRSIKAIIRVVEGPKGFRVIALTRLTPIPFGLQNAMFAVSLHSFHTCNVSKYFYFSQLTNIKFSSYIFASMLGLFFTQLLNTYMGSTLRNMHEVLADRADGYIILISQVKVILS